MKPNGAEQIAALFSGSVDISPMPKSGWDVEYVRLTPTESSGYAGKPEAVLNALAIDSYMNSDDNQRPPEEGIPQFELITAYESGAVLLRDANAKYADDGWGPPLIAGVYNALEASPTPDSLDK